MTRDRYLDMMEQLGKEPHPDEIPPDFEDLPEIITIAVNTFNLLGDRIYPEIGYIGKDYTNLLGSDLRRRFPGYPRTIKRTVV